jgi:hypothetical protein
MHAPARKQARRTTRDAAMRLLPVAALLLPLAALLMICGGSASLASAIATHHGRGATAGGGLAARAGGTGVAVSLAGGARAVVATTFLPPPSAEACASLVADWVAASDARAAARAAAPKPNLTFFLHVPRTAGRTLFFCGLKPAFPPSQRCERAYDHVRTDTHAPACGLLSSHDDFRLVESFPGGGAVLITQLRDPVDRLLSAYEFAVEVAARGVGQRDRKLARLAEVEAGRARPRVETTQVWPWDVLVPMLARDMDARLAAVGGTAPRASAYNCSLIMPLHVFAAHPVVVQLLHNGATFQLLGLTNNSGSVPPGAGGADAPTAAALRACAARRGAAADALAAAAQRRLETEVDVVLLKERLHDSIALMAAALGRPLSGRSYRSGDGSDNALRAELAAARGEAAAMADARARVDAAAESADSLGVSFARCAASQRVKSHDRRARGLKKLLFSDGKPLSFDRAQVPPALLAELAGANALDAALHAAGTRLFEAQRAKLAREGRLEELVAESALARVARDTRDALLGGGDA